MWLKDFLKSQLFKGNLCKSVQRIYQEDKGLGIKVSFFRASSWDHHLGGRVGGRGEGRSRIG